MKILSLYILFVLSAVVPPYKAAAANPDLDTIRNRVLEELLDQDIEPDEIQALIHTINEDGSWPGIDYDDVSRTGFQQKAHVTNIKNLSLAYRKPDSAFHGDAGLKKALALAIDYWADHDFIASNWHTNEISNPLDWTTVLLLVGDELTYEQVAAVSGFARRGNLQAWGARPGGDLIKIAGIVAELALFEGDEATLRKGVDAMVAEVKVTSGLGIKPDLGFHHRTDRVTSILAYGTGYAATFANWAYRLNGTDYGFPEEALKLLIDYYLDGICKSMVHGWYKDPGVINRGMAREGSLDPIGPELPEKLLKISDYRRDELEKIVAIRRGASKPDLKGNRFFWHSEYFSHQRPRYFASVRMFSERNHNMEYPHNEESLKHHHYADGSNFISRTGREYYNIFPTWDWQKIPGTTVVQKPEIPHWNEIVKKGKTDFVGAVSDGSYGTAAFDFVSPHDPLVARKSWFFFDNEYVCLGTGISSEAEYPVLTTINQTLLNLDITVNSGGKEKRLKKGDLNLKDVAWVFHDSIAYYFPSPSQVSLSSDAFTGSWQDIVNTKRVQGKPPLTKDIFALWFDHGVKPENESYEYIVVPGVGLSEVGHYDSSLAIRILSNTKKIQAVQQPQLNLTQMVFYEPETIAISDNLTLTSKSPGLVMLETSEKGVEKITVADPTRKLEVFELEMTGDFRGQGQDWKATQNGNISNIFIRLPTGPDAGKSITIQNGEFNPGTPDAEEDIRLTKAKKSDHPGEEGKHYIGEPYGGGVVIWLDDSGEHGLIASALDQSPGISWRNGRVKTPQMYGDHGDRVTNARSDGTYAGQLNTALIIAQQTGDDITGNFAAKVCNECTISGYGDWYLPSKAELELMYQLKNEIGGFDQEMYWSSTEYNIGFVWGQNFRGYGGQYTQNKGSSYAVRCVRRF